jgi:hypothetical protein
MLDSRFSKLHNSKARNYPEAALAAKNLIKSKLTDPEAGRIIVPPSGPALCAFGFCG